MTSSILSARPCPANPSPPAGDGLEAALVPIIARWLESGRGPARLVGWLRGRVAGVPLPAPGGRDDEHRRFVRRLAREAARAFGRAGLPAATYQMGETVRPVQLGV